MSNQSYKVYGLSGTFFAQNERTGVIDITDSNFFNVLQYAINNTTGGTVRVLWDNYILDQQINIPSNVTLEINGYITLANNYNGHMLAISQGASNIKIIGNCTLDGNKTNQNPPNPVACIYVDSGSSNIQIQGITCLNSHNWSINFAGNNSVISDCIFGNCNNGFIFATPTSYNNIIRNCTVYGVPNDWGIIAYGGAYNIKILSCTAYNITGGSGIGILSDQWRTLPCHDILIDSCISYNNTGSGISSWAISGHHFNIKISNSDSYKNNTSNGWAGNGGYAIISSDNVIITGNISHENGNGSNGSCGYYIQDCNHVSCYSNKTFNEGIGSNNNGSGFLLYNINKSVIIQGNEIYDNQTTRTMNIGINALNSMTDCNAIYNYISPSIPYLVFQASYFTNVLGNIT